MKKILQSKYAWVIVLLVLVLANMVASRWHTRIDLTAEKRYTISAATKKLIRSLEQPVTVTVLLDGNLPAGFKKLAGSTRDMLQEFREIGGNKIQYFFRQPGEGLSDSLKVALLDSLQHLGISPANIRAQVKEGEGEEQRLVYPGAIIEYNDQVAGINLLQGQSTAGDLNTLNSVLNNADALLEYKLAATIEKLRRDTVPVIGYLVGNGQPQNFEVYDLIERAIKQEYRFTILPIDSVPVIPDFIDALVMVKPQQAFTDAQKLKLDQYVMYGGKTIWLIDKLYASMDSLQRSQGDFIAFDMGLNLDDLLFKYGVRINPDLLQDLNCTQIPFTVGMMGDKPQMQLLPWSYFPLLASPNNNPISKNLDYVMAQFPQSLDTIESNGIQKTILLASSTEAKLSSTPARVELNSARTEEDKQTFTQSGIPVAVLLEGRFNSLYNNRVSSATKDSLSVLYKQPFKAAGDNKMIVVSDADIVTNSISQQQGPLQMGENLFTHYKYANREFFSNCLEYLVGNAAILETRGKDYTLRLLNKQKLEQDRGFWQWINIGLPILLIVVFAFLYIALLKRKFQS